MHPRAADKQAKFAELLDRGVTALHMDARVADLRVPPHLRSKAWLVLNFSYGYQLHDFGFDDDGVIASLSFGGRPFPCFVPWEAVFAMSDDERDTFFMWQEDMPAEALANLNAAAASVEAGRSEPDADADAPSTADATALPIARPALAATRYSAPQPDRSTAAVSAAPKSPASRIFGVIEGGGGSSDPTSEAAETSSTDAPPDRSHLRRIK